MLFFRELIIIIRLLKIEAEVVEWQTRRTQNPLMVTSCGFKSHLRHQTEIKRTKTISRGSFYLFARTFLQLPINLNNKGSIPIWSVFRN